MTDVSFFSLGAIFSEIFLIWMDMTVMIQGICTHVGIDDLTSALVEGVTLHVKDLTSIYTLQTCTKYMTTIPINGISQSFFFNQDSASIATTSHDA